MKFKSFLTLSVLYGSLAFPMFYFVYKFGNPEYGTNDFFSYYKLYKDWDIGHVDAPFNMRLLSSFFVYLLNKVGLHYETITTFDKFGLDKGVFFNAILFNFICIILTCVLLFQLLNKHFANIFLSFIGGTFYLFGFGTLFYEFMPITDALSVFIFSIILYGYLNKSYWIIFPLLILIIQREYIFLALGFIALLDLIKFKLNYYLNIALICVLFFATYYVLRKTVFYTPKYDYQASPLFFMDSINTLKFPLLPYIKQTFMTLNLFFLYLLILIYKVWLKMEIDKYSLVKILLLLFQINIISFAAVFGNNTGRYFYMLIPLVIFQMAKEAFPLLLKK